MSDDSVVVNLNSQITLNALADIIKGSIPLLPLDSTRITSPLFGYRKFVDDPNALVNTISLTRSYTKAQLISYFLLSFSENPDSVPDFAKDIVFVFTTSGDYSSHNTILPEIIPLTVSLQEVKQDGKNLSVPVKKDSFVDGIIKITFPNGSKAIITLNAENSRYQVIHGLNDLTFSKFFEELEKWIVLNHPFKNNFISFESGDPVLKVPHYMSRSDLLFPDSLWQDIDDNIYSLFDNYKTLFDLGLRSNRGVLVYGPPGCGKTAIGRTIFTDMIGHITVIMPDSVSILHYLEEVYELAADLAPSLVVLEDLDLVAKSRNNNSDSKGALQSLLTVLDGASTNSSGIVTLASTNDPKGIDPAARRSARFDVELFVDLPDASTRIKIFQNALAKFNLPFEIHENSELIKITDKFSGSDILEVVISTFLRCNINMTLEDLCYSAEREKKKALSISQSFDFSDLQS